MAILTIAITACRKKPDPVTITSLGPELSLKFVNTIDDQPLTLKQNYLNANGDTFYITSYKYYISNIRLTDENGREYVENESYYLIDEKKSESKNILLADIPNGNWKTIKFLIGVDSIRNVAGSQTGALDPLNGMFWDWNTGYIMAALEGSSPQAGPFPNNLAFHLGGYYGPKSVLKWIEMPIPGGIVTDSNFKRTIFIQSDVNEWFKTPLIIDFSQMSNVSQPGTGANTLATNYADMFSISKVE